MFRLRTRLRRQHWQTAAIASTLLGAPSVTSAQQCNAQQCTIPLNRVVQTKSLWCWAAAGTMLVNSTRDNSSAISIDDFVQRAGSLGWLQALVLCPLTDALQCNKSNNLWDTWLNPGDTLTR